MMERPGRRIPTDALGIPIRSRTMEKRLVVQHRFAPHLIAAVALAAQAACDSSSATGIPEAEPSMDPGGEPSLVITGPDVVTLFPSETASLEVRVLDSEGKPLEVEPVLAWHAQVPERVAVDERGGLRAGARPGNSWVYVEGHGRRDSVAVWVQPPPWAPSGFRIELYFEHDVPPWWRDALEDAAERWERVVRAALPEVEVESLVGQCALLETGPRELREGTEDGVRVLVRVSEGFSPESEVRATGGVCASRPLPEPTSVIGLISLNASRIGAEPPPDLDYLTSHELGHALGLVGIVRGEQPDWLDPSRRMYRGHLALFGYSLDGGADVPYLEYHEGGHWRFPELMGTTRSGTISHASVGALMDLGYPAAWYGSGPIDDDHGDDESDEDDEDDDRDARLATLVPGSRG